MAKLIRAALCSVTLGTRLFVADSWLLRAHVQNANITSSTKPEVHNAFQRRCKASPCHGNITGNKRQKLLTIKLWFRRYVRGQTDKQTRSITTLCSSTGMEYIFDEGSLGV